MEGSKCPYVLYGWPLRERLKENLLPNPGSKRRLRILGEVPQFGPDPAQPGVPKVLLLLALVHPDFGQPLALHFLLTSFPLWVVLEGTAGVQEQLVDAPVLQVVVICHRAPMTHSVQLAAPRNSVKSKSWFLVPI